MQSVAIHDILLMLSADRKSSQKVNDLKCQKVLIQIRPDILYACSRFKVYANKKRSKK